MLKKLSESIYYLSNQNDKERPTLGLVCGEKYSLVVDGGNSAVHARQFLKEIEHLDVPPIKYLVITHTHWDHFLGMNEFNATVIVNSLTHQKMEVWQKYSYDDRSLQEYVDSNKITLHCMEIIQQEIPEREQFKLSYPDIVFEESLTVDLGNKVCILERIRSTHTDDSTIVYVPDDKTIFLGDSVYGTTTDAIFHYKASQLRPMIEDIQKYDANHFLLGHESICDLDEMNVFWDQLTSCNRAVNSTSLDHAIECFEQNNLRSPQGDELFFLKAFVNHQILISK
ncbi:MBL fold metallo-hydrolase [Paenibacillus urinalis]|uniref:MBL fold metallo-hydrolase n=1 Tax=Paenibacillus urinalis TaxID=521520 RepID=A0ABY7X759_9BACL|nr:MBL fold metallo-hydrolase [Paenibacillus urinalis]WDH96907.1 MBL fold metallo-hydrolase [Paenibacillus urinalis]WDI00551.1 MBL fold metallo-hydrolase [Paenibacillus urinalis]